MGPTLSSVFLSLLFPLGFSLGFFFFLSFQILLSGEHGTVIETLTRCQFTRAVSHRWQKMTNQKCEPSQGFGEKLTDFSWNLKYRLGWNKTERLGFEKHHYMLHINYLCWSIKAVLDCECGDSDTGVGSDVSEAEATTYLGHRMRRNKVSTNQ